MYTLLIMDKAQEVQVVLHNSSKSTFNGIKPGSTITVSEELSHGYLANGFSYVDADGNVKDELNHTPAQARGDQKIYTVKELKALLDGAGVTYANKANLATLTELAETNNLLDDGNDLTLGGDDKKETPTETGDLDENAGDDEEDDLDNLGSDLAE